MLGRIIKYIKSILSVYVNKIRWRKQNRHNFTTAGNFFSLDKVTVGNYSYGSLQVYEYGEENSKLDIGNLCSIALNVHFVLGGNHFVKGLMTYPISPMLINNGIGCYSKGPIVIGHDCWLGFGSILLSGVTLGNGCVVAAGSIVTKSFPAYSIVGGNPAKLIKMRFEQSIIDLLNDNQWIYQMNSEWYNKFYQTMLNEPTIEDIGLLLSQKNKQRQK